MKYSFCRTDLNEADFHKIHELDKRCYDKKYVISVEDIKQRYNKNPFIYFSIRDLKGRLIGYTSVIPLKEKAYFRLKNGEIDKEVITIDDIIPPDEKITDLYFDSIVIDSKYRKLMLGRKLIFYVFQELSTLYPGMKRVLGNVVSEGGYRLMSKRGLKKVDKNTGSEVICEKVIKGKSYSRKKVYKNRDKHVVAANKVKKVRPHLCSELF